MKKTWYEVFKSTPDGTRTFKICATLKEARAIKSRERAKDKTAANFYIDKWRNLGSPENLGART